MQVTYVKFKPVLLAMTLATWAQMGSDIPGGHDFLGRTIWTR